MQQYLPKDGFKWANDELDVKHIVKTLENVNEKSPIGMILEVDISYPQYLHDEHKDLPYLPEKNIPPNGRFPKLMSTLNNKKNYVVHHLTLKQSLKAGLTLDKVRINIMFMCKYVFI